MIKFVGTTPLGATLVFLGITGENVTRLTAGEPIAVELSELGLPPMRVVITYGKTERHIVADLERACLLPPGTASDLPTPTPDRPSIIVTTDDGAHDE